MYPGSKSINKNVHPSVGTSSTQNIYVNFFLSARKCPHKATSIIGRYDGISDSTNNEILSRCELLLAILLAV
jgi:hypothetical protein